MKQKKLKNEIIKRKLVALEEQLNILKKEKNEKEEKIEIIEIKIKNLRDFCKHTKVTYFWKHGTDLYQCVLCGKVRDNNFGLNEPLGRRK